MDDIYILGESKEEVRKISQALRLFLHNHKVSINENKTMGPARILNVLGKMVEDCIYLTPEQSVKLETLKFPTTLKKKQKVMGFINFIREHVPHSNEIINAINNNDPQTFQNKIKNPMFIRIHPVNEKTPIDIYTDYSKKGMGAVFIQENKIVERTLSITITGSLT